MLLIKGSAVVVIGGGRIATRKVSDLVASGAHVTLISPTLSPKLQRFVREGRVRHRARRYRHGDLKGSRVAIAATPDSREQARIAAEARLTATWVNVVDQPALCDFIAPAVFRRGRLTLTVSTDGTNPALARWVKRRLATVLGAEYAEVASVLARLRSELRAAGVSPAARRRMTDRLMDADLPSLVRTGDRRAITRLIRRVTGFGPAGRPKRSSAQRRRARNRRHASLSAAAR